MSLVSVPDRIACLQHLETDINSIPTGCRLHMFTLDIVTQDGIIHPYEMWTSSINPGQFNLNLVLMSMMRVIFLFTNWCDYIVNSGSELIAFVVSGGPHTLIPAVHHPGSPHNPHSKPSHQQENYFRKYANLFVFFIISQHCDGKCHWNPPFLKPGPH